VTTKNRFGLFPNTPTVSESGVPGYESTGWYAMWAPAATPPAIISMLNREVTKALTSPAMKEQLGTQGLQPIPSSPEAFAKRLRLEIEQWGKVVKATGAKPE
jgi:tripartite-type tricarboxylate transporter receptor subunit TctC